MNYSLREIAKALNRSWWWMMNFKKKTGLKVKTKNQSLIDSHCGHVPSWKGGRIEAWGYWKIWRPDHPKASNNYVLEHRLVMEEKIGRLLKEDEIVHHLDGNKKNNNPNNLQLLKRGGGQKFHGFPTHCPKCNFSLEHLFK